MSVGRGWGRGEGGEAGWLAGAVAGGSRRCAARRGEQGAPRGGGSPCGHSCAASPCAAEQSAAQTARRGRASWAGPQTPVLEGGGGRARRAGGRGGAGETRAGREGGRSGRGQHLAHGVPPRAPRPTPPSLPSSLRPPLKCARTLCSTSRVLPLRVPNSEPLPSMMMKPYLRRGRGGGTSARSVVGDAPQSSAPPPAPLTLPPPQTHTPTPPPKHPPPASPVVRFQQLVQRLCVELVVAEVKGGVDGLEGLKVDVQLLLLPILCQHRASVHNQPVGRHLPWMDGGVGGVRGSWGGFLVGVGQGATGPGRMPSRSRPPALLHPACACTHTHSKRPTHTPHATRHPPACTA